MSGTIIKVSGPLVVAEGLGDANVSDVVRVGPDRLIGEILNMTGDPRADRRDHKPRHRRSGAQPQEEVDVYADRARGR